MKRKRKFKPDKVESPCKKIKIPDAKDFVKVYNESVNEREEKERAKRLQREKEDKELRESIFTDDLGERLSRACKECKKGKLHLPSNKYSRYQDQISS